MASDSPQQLVYFISGMWCSSCAKSIRESVSKIDGVAFADVNYASKLMLVRPHTCFDGIPLDQSIQAKVSRIGFGIKKQSEGWVLNFHESLQKETNRKIPWTQVSLVWFLAMWSSMLAFAGYAGGDLSLDERYYLALASSIFGLPAIALGIFPYANAGLRALWFSKILTLDLFIFIGGCSAIGASAISLLSHSYLTYADSGSMIVAILLLTKKIENSITTAVTSNILFQLHPKKKTVDVLKKGHWIAADITQVRRGDHVRVPSGETVPFDGILESDSAAIDNHLMNGEARPVLFKKGDHIFAGAIAQGPLEAAVTHPQGERKIDAWAEAALLADNAKTKYFKIFSKIESRLVLFAFIGALLIAGIQLSKGAGSKQVIESFFVGILIFCPCLFASIIPLTRQLVHLALLKNGLLISRTDALLDLSRVKNFYFDKTGTLEAVESAYVPFENTGEAALAYVSRLADQSTHAILRGLRLFEKAQPIQELKEHPGKGISATFVDGTEILVGRPSFLREMGVRDLDSNSIDSLVSMNRRVVGQIIRKSVYDEHSRSFLKKLLILAPQSKIEILSGDPTGEAGRSFADLNERISYQGGLSPEGKADLIQGSSAFVGDGLNDTLALAKARVGFRIGHRIQGFAPADFHLQVPNLDLVLTAIQYSRKYKKVLAQTAGAAFLYNVSALGLAALGQFSPLGAVLSMLASFSIMLLSISRLSKVQGVV